MLKSTHAAAQLVKIGQAVVVGLVDENRVGVGDVQAALDDRRRHQHIDLAAHELQHRLFQLVASHLAMRHRDPHFGDNTLNAIRDFLNVLHTVMDEIDLSLAVQLAQNRVADQLVIEADDARFDGKPIWRRSFQIANVADAEQRQVQRARDRRRRHR